MDINPACLHLLIRFNCDHNNGSLPSDLIELPSPAILQLPAVSCSRRPRCARPGHLAIFQLRSESVALSMRDHPMTVSSSLLKTWTDGAVRDPAMLVPLKPTQSNITLRFSGIMSRFGSRIAMAGKAMLTICETRDTNTRQKFKHHEMSLQSIISIAVALTV